MVVKFASEKEQVVLLSHWYSLDGVLTAYVENKSKPGETRPATLRDARPQKLFPSATTILQVLAKPALTDWLIEMAVKEAFNYQLLPGMVPAADIIKQIANKGKEIGFQKAEEGTTIHDLIESEIKTQEPRFSYTPLQKQVSDEVMVWLDANGFRCTESERRFVCERYGYAGTIDFLGTYYDEPCIVDFKTQDAETIKDFKYYEEWPLQLAMYDLGYPLIEGSVVGEERRRIEVIISRTNPGVIMPKEYSKGREHDNEAALALVKFWQHQHRYFPHLEEEVLLQEGLGI